MNDSKIGARLREQIVRFSGELSRGLCKPARRFVAEAVYGIQARQSVMLSEIARSLNEPIALKKTETRLSNEIKRAGLRESLLENLLSMASPRIEAATLLVIDISDISKDYARHMEYLARVRDGSTGELTNGYWTLKVIGSELEEVHMTPLYEHLYSQDAPGFVSENEEILKAVDLVSSHVAGKGIWVIDRGGDRHKLYHPLLDRGLRFLVRLMGDRHLVCRGRRVRAWELASRCPMLCAERVVREKDGKEKVYRIEYGYRRVRLPGRREQLTLVVVRGFGAEPMMLLTNVEVKRSRKSLDFIVHSYLRRWQIEDTIRCTKQSYDLENVRLLSYERLQNMMVLAHCALYFAAVHLGDRIRLKVLAYRALTAAKRLFGIPDFRYYALADGIKALLEGLRSPFVVRQVSGQPQVQPNLFDP
jgi:hypothetical protein